MKNAQVITTQDETLDKHLPFAEILISPNCNRIGEETARLIVEEHNIGLEAFAYILIIKDDKPIIRDVFFPLMQVVDEDRFEVTSDNLSQLEEYVGGKQKETGRKFVQYGTMHWHTSGRVPLTPNDKMINWRDKAHFEEGAYTITLSTREFLDEFDRFRLLGNQINVAIEGNCVVIRGRTKEHATLKIPVLPSDIDRGILTSSGLPLDSIAGLTSLDILVAYLTQVNEFAKREGIDPITATQYRSRGHCVHLIWDSKKNSYGEVGVVLENLYDGGLVIYRRKLPLKITPVDNDTRYDEAELRARLQAALYHSANKLFQPPTDQFNLNAFLDKPFVQPQTGIKVSGADYPPENVVEMFVYNVMAYLAGRDHVEHRYSDYLDDLIVKLSFYTSLGLTTSILSLGELSHDTAGEGESYQRRPSRGALCTTAYQGILNGMRYLSSSNYFGPLEQQFMAAFNKAPTVAEKNGVLERYVPQFLGPGQEVQTDG